MLLEMNKNSENLYLIRKVFKFLKTIIITIVRNHTIVKSIKNYHFCNVARLVINYNIVSINKIKTCRLM